MKKLTLEEAIDLINKNDYKKLIFKSLNQGCFLLILDYYYSGDSWRQRKISFYVIDFWPDHQTKFYNLDMTFEQFLRVYMRNPSYSFEFFVV